MPYNFFTRNCGDLPEQALERQGFNLGTTVSRNGLHNAILDVGLARGFRTTARRKKVVGSTPHGHGRDRAARLSIPEIRRPGYLERPASHTKKLARASYCAVHGPAHSDLGVCRGKMSRDWRPLIC